MTKKKENPLVHIRLEGDEAMQMKKDILQLEMGVVRTLQIINRYRELRKNSYDKKNKIYENIKQAHSELNKMKKVNFPKIDKNSLIKKIEKKYNEEPGKKETKKEDKKNNKIEKKTSKKKNKKQEKKPETTKEKLKSTIKKPSKKTTSQSKPKKPSKEKELENELKNIQAQLKKLDIE